MRSRTPRWTPLIAARVSESMHFHPAPVDVGWLLAYESRRRRLPGVVVATALIVFLLLLGGSR